MPTEEDNQQQLPVPALDMSKVKHNHGNLPLAYNSPDRESGNMLSAIRLNTEGSALANDADVYMAFAHSPARQDTESETGLTPAASKHYDCVNPLYR